MALSANDVALEFVSALGRGTLAGKAAKPAPN